jgi:hypothetical protein
MPVISWGHSHYWQTQTPAGPPPPETGASGSGGYVTWMTPTVLSGSMFGGLQPVYEWIVKVATEKVTR